MIPRHLLDEVVRRALDEDLAGGDVTTDSVVPPDAAAVGVSGTTVMNFSVNMGSTMATYGGSKEFTITLTQASMPSITYEVTVTVKRLTKAMTFSKLGLTPVSSAWTIVDTGTTPTRPVTVNVPNGTTEVRIQGDKESGQGVIPFL